MEELKVILVKGAGGKFGEGSNGKIIGCTCSDGSKAVIKISKENKL